MARRTPPVGVERNSGTNMVLVTLAHLGAAALSLLSSLGRVGLFLGQALGLIFIPPLKIRRIIRQMHFIGARSLLVIALTGLFTGMVLALQGYYTLTRFGSEGYLGPAVAISLITELGPVLSALMVAGRFAEVRQKGLEVTDTLRSCGDVALTEVASELMDRWQGGYLWGRITGDMVSDILSRIAAERAVGIASACIALALQNIAQTLGLSDAPR